MRGRFERNADGAAVRLGDGGAIVPLPRGRAAAAGNGANVILGFRPEHVGRANAGPPADGYARFEARIELIQPTGSRSYATFRLADRPAMGEPQAHDVSRAGEQIRVDINLRSARLFDPGTGRAL